MKSTSLLSILLLIILASCSKIEKEQPTEQNLHGQDAPIGLVDWSVDFREPTCKSTSEDCTASWGEFIFEMENYPGCSAFIYYDFEICSDPNSNSIIINVFDFEFQAFENSNDPESDCSDFQQAMDIAIENDMLDEFNTRINREIWGQIDNQLQIQYWDFAPFTTINYSIASCTSICYVDLELPQIFSVVQQETNCGYECCKRTTTYKAVKNGWEVESQTWDYPETYCESNELECPENTIMSTACTGNCQELVGF